MVLNEVIMNVDVFGSTGDSVRLDDADGTLIVRKKVQWLQKRELKRATEEMDP